MVSSLTGEIWDVRLGLGHNNDQGMLGITKMKEFLIDNDIKLLADRGYKFLQLVTPNDDTHSVEWNNRQKGLRSVVETTCGMVKLYEIAALTCRQSPDWHELALMVCYQLTNINLKLFPLRYSL